MRQLLKDTIDTVLFDLGGTLVQYYSRSEFPEILEQAIGEVQAYLRQEGIGRHPLEQLWAQVEKENHEAADHRVRPLEGRLARIFRLEETIPEQEMDELCRRFMRPIFARARRYDDTAPALEALHEAGYRLAIVSNTPWGCPAHLWREELARHDLDRLVETAVFCRDVGWRKPAAQVFHFVLNKLGVGPEQCLFVGDDPRWDVAGPRQAGIAAILVDREGNSADVETEKVRSLDELPSRLASLP